MKPAQLVLLLAANMAFATGCSSTADSLSGTASVAEAYGPDTVTCRHVIITGTRIGTKVCRKNSEWDADAPKGRAFAERIQRRGNIQHQSGQ